MADRVDAAVQLVKSARAKPPPDRPRPQAAVEKLPAADDAVLALGQFCDRAV